VAAPTEAAARAALAPLRGGGLSANAHPHITLTTAPGVASSTSNRLIEAAVAAADEAAARGAPLAGDAPLFAALPRPLALRGRLGAAV
jgi:hypothetical protein